MNAEQVTNGARALGLHPVPAALLSSLVADGPASQAALAVRLGVAPSTVCRAVRALDDMGLVEMRPLRRRALVRAVPFEASLPALAERHRQQLAGALRRLTEACALLGVPVPAAGAGRPEEWAVQPLPVGSCEPPYLVPQTGFAGGDLNWRLSEARQSRDMVLSAMGAALQVPNAQQLRWGRTKSVRVVVTSCDSMDQLWRRRLAASVAAGVEVRAAAGRAAPFTIVDGQRVCLRVLVAGEQRRVWVREPEQVASLIRLFEALWADGCPVDLATLQT